MSRRKRSPEEQARREKIRELLRNRQMTQNNSHRETQRYGG